MSGERRRVEVVVVRGLARLLAAGTALTALGALALVGCMWSWARDAGADPSVLWMLGGIAAVLFVGGMFSVVAFEWARA